MEKNPTELLDYNATIPNNCCEDRLYNLSQAHFKASLLHCFYR